MSIIKQEEPNYPDLNKMCRLCLKENAGTIDIFDSQQSLVLRIMTCTSIEVRSSDPLAKLICESCRVDLEKSYYFRKRSQNCNNKLKKHLRLINAGRKSTVFEINSENDDDEFELEDSLTFLREIEKKQKQKEEFEINERLQHLVKLQEQEFTERFVKFEEQKEMEISERLQSHEAKHERELYDRIKKLKDEHDKAIKRKKQDFQRQMSARIKILKKNLRKEESNRILDDIKEFLNTKQIENLKRPRILNLEAFNSANDSQTTSKKQKQSPVPILQRKNTSNERSRIKSITPTTSAELFNIEPQPPETLFKFTYNDDGSGNGDSERLLLKTSIDAHKLDDTTRTKVEIDEEDNDDDFMQSQKNIEILDYQEETVSEYDEQSYEDHEYVEEKVQEHESLEVDYIRFNDPSNSDVSDTENGQFHDNENSGKLIEDDNISLRDDDTNQSIDSQKAIESAVQQSLLKQDNINIDRNVKFDMEKVSDKITQVTVTTKGGNVILMEVQTKMIDDESKTDAIIADITSDSKPSATDDAIRIFRCQSCPQAFSREALLLRHKVVHEKSRGYSCHYCDKWFACKSSLKRHTRVHTGEKPFSCEECGRSFIQKEILKRHMLTHTGERPYKCSHCDQSFVQKPLLRQHINQKHTENPVRQMHECHLCPKVFMHASGLSRHLITHTGVSFNCIECGRSFSDKSALKRHMIGVHMKSEIKKDNSN